jgi:mannosyltransferase OCH1-like enzyme
VTELARIIHFIWVGPKPIPISFVKQMLPTWQSLNPLAEIKIWTEKEVLSLADEGVLVNKDVILNTTLNPGLRADFLRLELLYLFGGLYADVDMTCEKNLDPLFKLSAG